jgi:type IV fimbrial biogenesis protein FimT
MKTIKYNRGMTLVELMITVSILSILVSVAVPNMVGMINDSRLSGQTDLLVATLASARLEAIQRRNQVIVCAASAPNTATNCSSAATAAAAKADWSKGWIVGIDADADGSIDSNGVIQRVVANKNIQITPDTVSVKSIFNPTIGNATAAATYAICISGRNQQSVAVNLTGKITKAITSTVCS